MYKRQIIHNSGYSAAVVLPQLYLIAVILRQWFRRYYTQQWLYCGSGFVPIIPNNGYTAAVVLPQLYPTAVILRQWFRRNNIKRRLHQEKELFRYPFLGAYTGTDLTRTFAGQWCRRYNVSVHIILILSDHLITFR